MKNKSPDRSTKGSSDIKLQNKYGTLEEESSMELSVDIPKPYIRSYNIEFEYAIKVPDIQI